MKIVPRSAVLLLSAVVGLTTARAQTATHAPDGGSVERLQSITISPKTDAPFSATVVTTWTRVLEDGTHSTVKNHRTVARDSTGRIFEERRFLTATGDLQETPLSQLEYTDPGRHEFYMCNPRAKICIVSEYNPPPSMVPVDTPAVTPRRGAAVTVQRESLGQNTIENVEVVGSREITTANPGANGYTRPEPTIKEFWYSSRLDLNVVVKRFLPRGGLEDFAVTNLNLNEPDPQLFSPPADYKIVHTSQY